MQWEFLRESRYRISMWALNFSEFFDHVLRHQTRARGCPLSSVNITKSKTKSLVATSLSPKCDSTDIDTVDPSIPEDLRTAQSLFSR